MEIKAKQPVSWYTIIIAPLTTLNSTREKTIKVKLWQGDWATGYKY